MTDEEIQALQTELESTKGELEGLKAEKETFAGELESRNAKITDLEMAVAEKDNRLSSVNVSLSQAVSGYKAMVVKSNPGVIEELITGDTIEAIDKSVEDAKALIGKVRSSIEQEIAAGKVPAGAPARTLPDLSALSPREKIQYAIGGKK